MGQNDSSAGGAGTSLADLFPSNVKRLQFVRVMFTMMDANLQDLPWEEPLDPELVARIQQAIRDDEEG